MRAVKETVSFTVCLISYTGGPL